MTNQEDLKKTLIHQSTLLPCESERDYRRLDDGIRELITPRDILEEMWTSEIVEAEWEILRLRRYKGRIVSTAKLTALRHLLKPICTDLFGAEIDDLARRWFTNKNVRKQVNSLLLSVGLDELAIDAEAYRQSLGDLTVIERRLLELASRRDKIFRQIEDYRAGLSAPAQSTIGQRLEQEIRVENGGVA